jgi:hypothetical protein
LTMHRRIEETQIVPIQWLPRSKEQILGIV